MELHIKHPLIFQKQHSSKYTERVTTVPSSVNNEPIIYETIFIK